MPTELGRYRPGTDCSIHRGVRCEAALHVAPFEVNAGKMLAERLPADGA
jgi:hypothetical protein